MKKNLVVERVAQERRRSSRAYRKPQHCVCCGYEVEDSWNYCRACKVALVPPEEYHRRDKQNI